MTETSIVAPHEGLRAPHDQDAIAPFLRWAGGKRWLVPKILDLLGAEPLVRYHEPFLGGGAVFFALATRGESFLSDLNTDLIEVYCQVRDDPFGVAERLAQYENTKDAYYAARRDAPTDALQRAARFVFLNHTSYNGIFRVNLRGEYNVPYGNRKYLKIPDEQSLMAVSQRLKGVKITACDFEQALSEVRYGDLVFLDPPYTVAHNNNGFVKYNQHLFSFEDQRRLAESVRGIAERGGRFILTNAAHHSIDSLFSPLGQRIEVSRRNSVGGRSAARGRAAEYVFTNLESA